MRNLRVIVAGLALLGAVSAVDMATPRSTMAAEIIIQTAPPAPRYEPIPVAPPGRYAWIPGYWTWGGRGFVWVPGRYSPMAARYNGWIPGHWQSRGHEWFWVPGHWR